LLSRWLRRAVLRHERCELADPLLLRRLQDPSRIGETVDIHAAVGGTFDRALACRAPASFHSPLFEDLTVELDQVFRKD
jgi:hypothetical protein